VISEFTLALVSGLAGGLMGLLIWLSVELTLERLRGLVVKRDDSQPELHRGPTGESLVQHAVQSMNLVIIAVLFGGPIEVRWLYLVLGFVAGAGLARLVYYLARQGRIRVDLEWLFS